MTLLNILALLQHLHFQSLTNMFVLKSQRKTYSYENRESALSVLLLAKNHGVDIFLESDTHYFDENCNDILLIGNKEILETKENEINNGNKRVSKSKSKN